MESAELWQDGAVTITGAVAFTGIGRTQMYKLLNRGELPYRMQGDRKLIPRRALVAYLAAGHVTGDRRAGRPAA